ncbi:uncharacterized protein LOC111040905 isoform X2 [Myzus persicae]|nr:uncharacterized protein LOC111040905 isoform X2 [Myzus persicae]
MANRNTGSCCCSDDDDDDDEEEDEEDEDDDDDTSGSCSSCSTAEADDDDDGGVTRRRLTSGRTTAAAAATSFDLLDARRLPDLLDAERLVAVLDGCLESEYVRGCVVETWDAVLSEHLEAIAHLVLYQTPEHAVSQAVYEQLVGLSTSLRPPANDDQHQQQQRPARVDAARVYGTLRSAARSLLTTRVDACCRQSMCRAVGLAVAALRCSTRPVFSVENFVVEINEAANFANLYCTGYAKRICAALEGIYDTVMAGDYHPTNVVVQMAVMDKCIRAAVRTLADGRATAAQKTAAQRSLLAELDDVGATVRMKNHGCVDDAAADSQQRRQVAVATASSTAARFVHFTMSPWRAPIRMYHQQSPTSVDQVLRATVRLVEALVAELFKPCLSGRHRAPRHIRRRRACSSRQMHDKQL